MVMMMMLRGRVVVGRMGGVRLVGSSTGRRKRMDVVVVVRRRSRRSGSG
jgi:hypothetical protein